MSSKHSFKVKKLQGFAGLVYHFGKDSLLAFISKTLVMFVGLFIIC